MAQERLQRTLARAGFGSRRGCEELIRDGRVTINGRVATLGDRIEVGSDEVRVDGGRIQTDPGMRYYLFNKPSGVVTTMDDPQKRIDLTAYLPPGPRVFPVGRLDRETEGLLILTNDGELANRLTHPRYGVEKQYLAEVEGTPSPATLAELVAGVELEDGPARMLRVTVGDRAGSRTALEVVMGEGRKREVRRLLAAVGFPIVRLVRLRVGPQRLTGVPPGEVRELTPGEVRELYAAVGL